MARVALKGILQAKAVNQWWLFWLITGPISASMMIAMLRTDLSSGPGVSSMIQLSVRCAIPSLYLAFAASSIRVLFSGPLSLWLLRNRKIFGLCFAAAMAWQALFIVWLVTIHHDYYMENVYVLRDVIEGILGYLFLVAMTLTSFQFGRRQLKPQQWKYLHKIGIYSLWVYAFSVYWWALFYYPDPVSIDYVYYWGGFLVWGLRAAAWRKKRLLRAEREDPQSSMQPAIKLMGLVVMAMGFIAVTFGSPWRKGIEEFTSAYAFSEWLVLYLPYWPFEPFLPLFVILSGVFVATKSGARTQVGSEG
jgi:DMSO/TMAO reductase YedYZ heme-binding membrane subunit